MQKLKILIVLIGSFFLSNNFQILFAHAPHDEISDVLRIPISKGYEILTIVRGNLFISINGNCFNRIVHGLDNVGTLSHLANSPINYGYVFLSTQGDGIYFSNNYGHSWLKRNNGLKNHNIDKIEISSKHPGLIIATGSNSGLYFSKNWGEEWVQVNNISNKITSINFIFDEIFLSDNTGKIFSLEVSDLSLKLFFSLPAEYGPILTMAISPLFNKTGEIFLGTERGLIGISLNQKAIIRKINKLPRNKVTSVKYSQNFSADNTLYALFGREGFFLSTDSGKNWQKLCKGLSTAKQAKEWGKSNYSSFKISFFEGSELIYICGFDGLFESENKGQQWVQLNTLSENLIVGLAISENYQFDSTLAYLTYLNGPVFSDSKGNKWESLFARGLILENLLGQGIIRLFDLVFYSDTSRSLFTISRSNIYQFIQSDNSWINKHLLEGKSRLIRKIKDRIVNLNEESAVIIKKIDNSKDLLIFTNNGKIYKYSPENSALTTISNINSIITSVTVSPNYKSDSTIFIGTEDEGLFKICGKDFLKVGFHKFSHLLVVVSSQLDLDSTLFVGTNSGLYKSENLGLSWSLLKVNEFSTFLPVSSIALSPIFNSDSTVLVTLKGFGLFKSDDGGEIFHFLGNELIENNYSFSPLNFFPANSGAIIYSPTYKIDSTVFAYSGCSVFRSENKGETWIKLPDYNFNIKKDIINIGKGAFFDFKYDLVILIILFIGVVLIVNRLIFHIKVKINSQ